MDFLSVIFIIALWIGIGKLFKPADPSMTQEELDDLFYNNDY